MVKSKNHTNANQSYKAHRNGIIQPKGWRRKTRSLQARGYRGMDPAFKKGMKIVNKHNRLVHLRNSAAKRRKRMAEADARWGKKRQDLIKRLEII